MGEGFNRRCHMSGQGLSDAQSLRMQKIPPIQEQREYPARETSQTVSCGHPRENNKKKKLKQKKKKNRKKMIMIKKMK